MARRLGNDSRWPDNLPFEPMDIPDAVGPQAEIINSLSQTGPELDPDQVLERSTRIVRSLAFLAGATEAGFVENIDAYMRAGDYGVRVVL